MTIEEYEVIVVGAGPSGLSAGIFVARQRAKCLLISKDLGGQMNMIPKLENYPGTIMSSGPLLAKTLENKYLTFNGEMTFDTVEKVDQVEETTNLKIKTGRSEYLTKALILAPGKVPNNLGVQNEIQFQNKGVHTHKV